MFTFVTSATLRQKGNIHYNKVSRNCILFGFQQSFLPHKCSTRLLVGLTRTRTAVAKKTLVCSLKKVLVPVADGTEEIEAVTIADTLVRAGAQVTIASVEKQLQITASRGIRIVADKFIGDCTNEQYDLIALPGGAQGAEKLGNCRELIALLRQQQQSGRTIGAICAAPALVLAENGFLEDNIRATCYPADQFLSKLKNPVDDEDRPVIVDGQFITSQGPGTALHFSLTLVERLYGRQKAEELAALMLLTPEDVLFGSDSDGANAQAVDVQEEAAI